MNTIAALPLVTIAIPTYNQKWCLADAIESALQQDYSNLEIIIADDCSSENISEIINKYSDEPRIRFYRNKTNLGRTGNYKKCLYQYAQGDWYLNLDGDDILIDKKFISKAIRYIQKNENIVLVSAACNRVVNEEIDYTIKSSYNENPALVNGKDFFKDIATKKAWISHLTSLYDRKKAMDSDFYRDDILSSDYESLFRLILTGDVLIFNDVAGMWRIHNSNESRNVLEKPGLIIKNFSYIENVSRFAKLHITEKEANSWKNRILKDQIFAFSLQFLLKKPNNYLKFTTAIFLKYPAIATRIQFKILYEAIKKINKSNN